MTKLKNLLMGTEAGRTVVFSGGACNAITPTGTLGRNTARDSLNAWLDEKGIPLFDPQIHPETHGRDYDYDQDGPAEQAARAAATVTLYQIGDETQAAVTCMEIVRDALTRKQLVIWLSGSTDAKNRPLFAPAGSPQSDNPVVAAHIAEYLKNGTNVRKNVVAFVSGLPNVTVVRTEEDAKRAIQACLS